MDIQRARLVLVGALSCSSSLFFSGVRRIPVVTPSCSSRRDSNAGNDSRDPNRGDGGDDPGDKYSTDWDKAWTKFKKQGKKTLFSEFSPNKYVSWNPRSSNYPLSEEVDPIKRAERSNLELWTGPKFTLAGAIVIVTFLLVYTILSPVK